MINKKGKHPNLMKITLCVEENKMENYVQESTPPPLKFSPPPSFRESLPFNPEIHPTRPPPTFEILA